MEKCAKIWCIDKFHLYFWKELNSSKKIQDILSTKYFISLVYRSENESDDLIFNKLLKHPGRSVAGIFFEGGHFLKLSKNFLRKLRIMHYFSIFFKKFNKPNFFRVWKKNAICWEILRKFRIFFDENSIEKLKFLFFGKFVTKNTAFENNTIFLRFSVSGGFMPCIPERRRVPFLSLEVLSCPI